MALRLTAPVPAREDDAAPTAPAAPAVPAVPAAQLLSVRAEAYLRARDVAAYRRLFAEAADVEDLHRRHQARRVLLETGLAHRPDSATPAAIAEVLAAVAAEALAVLEPQPAEPVLLNLAGVALYELGAVVPAEALFRAARRLDPELPHLTRNLAECARRRKAGVTTPAGLPGPVLAVLRAAGPRAKRVAAAARPATGRTISLCMIVRDEEAMLGRCLAAVAPAVDEIVVVDTGSTDRTVEIATSFGAKVLHHAWTGDFAAARNVSFDAATGDWVLYLDADEVLVEGDAPKLRELAGHVWREAVYLVETNHTGDLEDGTAVTHNALRLFRNRPEYRFEGRIHEQIAHRLPGFLPERLAVSGVRVEHFGYLGEVRSAKDKSRRNIELLEQQAAEGVDTPFLHFNLGSELVAVGDDERALDHFRTAWERVLADPELQSYGYVPSLAARFVKALRTTGRHAEALTAGEAVLRLLPGFTDVVLEQAHAAAALGDAARARELYERCLELGDAPSGLSATVGCGTFFALGGLATLAHGAGDLEGAATHLRRALEEHPGYLGAVEPLAGVLLRQGVPAAEAAAQVEALLGETPSPGARFLLAVPLYEAGAVAEAEAQLRGVLAARPAAHQARVALAEALLSQGRLQDAAAEAARVPADAPCAPAAARTAAFAVLADGGTPDLEAAREAGVPDAELRALAAWRDGGAAPGGVPAGAAPVLAVMLEALARLERFDAFERLAGAVSALALPARERRELLAGVYLRRGFLESAADEWLAACEEQGAPDARALRGLAEVARRRGMDEDAAVLAHEAELLGATP